LRYQPIVMVLSEYSLDAVPGVVNQCSAWPVTRD
jgi:hypothetical protein